MKRILSFMVLSAFAFGLVSGTTAVFAKDHRDDGPREITTCDKYTEAFDLPSLNKEDSSSGTVNEDWGSLEWYDNTVEYELKDGVTLTLCIKAGVKGTNTTPPVNGIYYWDDLTGEDSVSSNQEISHIAWAVTVDQETKVYYCSDEWEVVGPVSKDDVPEYVNKTYKKFKKALKNCVEPEPVMVYYCSENWEVVGPVDETTVSEGITTYDNSEDASENCNEPEEPVMVYYCDESTYTVEGPVEEGQEPEGVTTYDNSDDASANCEEPEGEVLGGATELPNTGSSAATLATFAVMSVMAGAVNYKFQKENL